MLLFIAELVDVQTGEYNSLVFKSKRFDYGLKKYVECSQSVGITDETMPFLANYKKHIGKTIAVGVNAIKTKKGTLYYMCQTDVLQPETVLGGKAV